MMFAITTTTLILRFPLLGEQCGATGVCGVRLRGVSDTLMGLDRALLCIHIQKHSNAFSLCQKLTTPCQGGVAGLRSRPSFRAGHSAVYTLLSLRR
jgi:hypothetical protein